MTDEKESYVLLEQKNNIGYVTLNRPEAFNALNHEVKNQLKEKLELAKEDPEIRVVIITGAGPKAFSSGADLDEVVQALKTPYSAKQGSEKGQVLFNVIDKLGKPTIAAINGYCLGGGCELILACTIRVASAAAKIGLPEIHLGILPGHGGIQRLVHLVGRDFATEMIITGDMVDAQEACRIGLVSYVVPPDQIISKAEEIAARIIKNGEIAVRLGLEAVYHSINLPLEQGLAIESALAGVAASTEDTQQRLKVILEKRDRKKS